MRAVDIIQKKRDDQVLSREEIAFLIRGHLRGEIPDYQITAFLMAVFFRGMTEEETLALTCEMLESGVVLDLSEVPGRKVDKHSTGGVGDKTSLIIAPIVAAAGIPVPMISGRGLGHTGGTLDKLESIPGFNVNLSLDQFRSVLKFCQMALIGQTREIAPADKKLYALRDVTATVESIPLISASIMSKKLAEGIDGLVLDVKTGKGAFMKEFGDARKLASSLVKIGRGMGKDVSALVTSMEQPLGHAIGNSLEVVECFEVLQGRGPEDLAMLSIELAARMILLGGGESDLPVARRRARELCHNGKALDRFRNCIKLQGGDPRVADDYSLMPAAQHRADVLAPRAGYVSKCDAMNLGVASMILGAGRETIDSIIDHAVGIVVHKKIGDPVSPGDPLCTMHYNDQAKCDSARALIESAFETLDYRSAPEPLIREVLSAEG